MSTILHIGSYGITIRRALRPFTHGAFFKQCFKHIVRERYHPFPCLQDLLANICVVKINNTLAHVHTLLAPPLLCNSIWLRLAFLHTIASPCLCCGLGALQYECIPSHGDSATKAILLSSGRCLPTDLHSLGNILNTKKSTMSLVSVEFWFQHFWSNYLFFHNEKLWHSRSYGLNHSFIRNSKHKKETTILLTHKNISSRHTLA